MSDACISLFLMQCFDCYEPSMSHALYRLFEAKDCDGQGSKCEATISKRLAWLVEHLVVSSHEFSFLLF